MPLPIIIHYQAKLDGEDPLSWELRPLYVEVSENSPKFYFELEPGKPQRVLDQQNGYAECRWQKKPGMDDCVKILAQVFRVSVEEIRVHKFDPSKPPPRVLP